MNHNPLDLKIGEIVLADKRHQVIILDFTPKKMYATIKEKNDPTNYSWQIMTARLSKLKTLTNE